MSKVRVLAGALLEESLEILRHLVPFFQGFLLLLLLQTLLKFALALPPFEMGAITRAGSDFYWQI